jgi:hypothetical protein
MNRLAIGWAALFVTASVMAADPDFSTMDDYGAALIGAARPLHAYAVYADEDNIYLVLQREVGRAEGQIQWQRLNYLTIPQPPEEQVFSFSTCVQNGTQDPGIAAISIYQDSEYFGKVVKAWRANIQAGTIDEIPPDGIVCPNDGYGA